MPGIMSGDARWVQGYCEPEAGSDLAGLKLRAVLDGDEWVLNGQKIWTSRGMDGTGMFMLARTDPDAPKHRGITFMLCELPNPGIEVRPIRTLTGDDEFCEIFFTDARVPVANTVGPINKGWKVANSLLGLERGEEAATNPIFFRAELDRIVQLARDSGRIDDPVIRDRLAWCHTKVEIMRFLGYRILTQVLRDGRIGPEASISKLYWSEYHQVATELAIELLGASAMVREGRKPFKHFRADEPGAANSTNSWIDVPAHERPQRHRLRRHQPDAAQHPRREHPRPPEGTCTATMSNFFHAYFAAWDRLDLDAVLAFFTDDVVYEDTTIGHGATGTKQMRRFVQASFDNVPDARFDYIGHVTTGTDFAVEWVMQPMNVRGVSIGTLRDGKIATQRDYWNGAAFAVPTAMVTAVVDR